MRVPVVRYGIDGHRARRPQATQWERNFRMARKHFLSLTNPRQIHWPMLVMLMGFSVSAWTAPSLSVPLLEAKLKVDGRLDEPCYQTFSPLEQFVVAGQPGLRPQRTRAWIFWQPSRL